MHQAVLNWVEHYGYIGLFSLLVLGIVGIPLPDEWLLAFSGYLVFKGTFRFAPALAAAFTGSACGISVSYGCGYSFGAYLLKRYGHIIHVTPEDVEKVREWFSRLGKWALVLGYFVPGGRHLTAYVAGTSRMRYRVFALFAYTGALIWSISFISAGYLWGDEWSRFSEGIHHDMIVGAVLAGAGLTAYFATRKRRVLE